MMPSSPKRPRDKGGTSLQHTAAKGFESSNSTMAMFLGGKKKGWMIGEQLPTDRPFIHKPQNFNSRTPKLGSEDTRSENLPPVGPAARSCQSPVDILPPAPHTSKPFPSTTSPPLATRADSQTAKPQNSDTEAVLPSPAPSDEPRQENIHIIDLEGGEEAEVASKQQLQIVQHLQERPNVSKEPHTPPASLDNTTNKRAMEDDLSSNKRSQNLATTVPVGPDEPLPQVSTAGATSSTTSALNFSPAEAEMRHFVGRITSRLEFVQRAEARRGPIEDGRLLLLRDACECYDHDYLLLHQLHCMKTRDPSCIRHFSMLGFGEQHLQGLHILDQLIRSNAELVYDAVEWFSEFPLPNRVLLERYAAYKLSYRRVVKCLEKLAEFWPRLRILCHERHYVPLVDELNAIDLRSVVLQRVISRAILRNIWLLPQDSCFHSSEKLFLINQQDVYQRDAQVSTSFALMEANKKAYNQKLVISYQKLWDQHQRHPSQCEHGKQAPSGQNLHYALPPAISQRRQSEQSQNQIPQARSASSNNAHSFDQARRPHTLNVNTQVNRRNSQVNSEHTPTLPSSPFPGAQRSPLSWSNYLAGQHSSSALPPSGATLPSNAETIGTAYRLTSTRNSSIASSPTSGHGHLHNQHPRRAPSTSSMTGNSSPALPFEGFVNSTEPETGLDSLLARAHGWTEQSPRAVIPPLPQHPHLIDAHRPHAGTQHQSRVHGQSPLQYSSGNIANRQLDLQVETQRQHTLPPYVVPPQFLPPLGYSQQTNTHPNPVESALHQAHVRSPILIAINSKGDIDKTMKYFGFMWGLAVMPNRLHMQKRHVRWTFTVSKESVQLLAKNATEFEGPTPTRTVNIGSRFCRVRCVRVSDIGANLSESDWAVADNTWPRNVAIILNGTALEIRRKLHYGKDLPIDVSQHIQEGQNTLSIATMWLPQENQAVYAVALETLEVTTDKKIKEEILTIERPEAQKRIIERASNVDPDIQIIDPSIVLDITDPYTSSIYEVPVRGKNCRHNQCFDLDVFLQTRVSKTPGEPCGPDQFKCPLCGGDARPQSLVVDGFFEKVREELSGINRLDAKAIFLQESGEWQIKEIEESEESGNGFGTRSLGSEELLPARVGKAPIRRESEVIEIDDD